MTLIELLVVLAVVALLVALLLPTLYGEKNKAIRIACVSNLKQTGLAFQVWSGDHGGKYPMAVPGKMAARGNSPRVQMRSAIFK